MKSLYLIILFMPLAVVGQHQGLRNFHSAKVVGAKKCAICHINESKIWKYSAHFAAFEKLHKKNNSIQIMKNLGVKNIKKSSCSSCHYTTAGKEKKAISGVSCESCHGPARDWILVHNQTFVPKKKRHSQVDANGMIRPSRMYHVAENCYQCHTVPNEKLVNVGGHLHNSPGFEFLKFFDGIRHNFLSGQGKNKSFSQAKKRLYYVIGIGLEFEYSLRGFAMATKKARYALKMSQKMRKSQRKLARLHKLTKLPEISQMKDAVKNVSIKLNNQKQFLAAAEKVKAANLLFVSRYTGREAALKNLDPLLPKGAATSEELESIIVEVKHEMIDKQSLYKRIGGEKTVAKAVDIFYDKVLKNKRLSHFFKDINMRRQKMKQRAFLTMVFGGPNYYSGKDLRNAHKHLVKQGLNDDHFDTIVELLTKTLYQLNVSGKDIAEVTKIAESFRDDILNREKSLYERLGGEKAVSKAVDIFYDKVLSDERIKHFFSGVNMQRQKMKQRAFLTVAFGGPSHYSGKDLRNAHKHLVKRGLNDGHFNAVVKHLAQTLQELGAKREDIAEVAKIAESFRDDILGRKKSLYVRMGGARTVTRAVNVFYDKVIKDKRVKHFFDNVDMVRQKMKQRAFLTMVFGGPNNYKGQDLRNAHQHLVDDGLKEKHFDIVIELLTQTLQEIKVSAENVKEVIKIAQSFRKDVLNH